MKIEIHLLQNFAPSCLNRDDTNTPKDCVFGGVRRARISSQSYKRALRAHFRACGSTPVGERTKRLVDVLTGAKNDELPADVVAALDSTLAELRAQPGFNLAAETFVDANYAKMDTKENGNTNVLLFLAPEEMKVAAARIVADWELLGPVGAARARKQELEAEGDKAAAEKVKVPEYKIPKETKAALETALLSSDIALFGRMLADHPNLKVEAASQVAHPISTHQVNPETDFFSAVDDLTQDQPGAGMLGVIGFNSACFYRYALLDFDALVKNLDGDTEAAMGATRAFLNAMIEAIPPAKQNSMAAQNPADFALLVVRPGGQPMSLANAFVTPIENGPGLMFDSIGSLDDYRARLLRGYGDKGARNAFFCSRPEALGQSLRPEDAQSCDEAVEATLQSVADLGAAAREARA